MPTKKLLIIAHTPSPNTKTLAEAIRSGAEHSDIANVSVELRSPFDCNTGYLLNSDGLIIFTTENFGYMSGALKDMFERVYYPCLEQPDKNEAKPYSLVIRAGLDGTGTNNSVHKIITGLKWREVQETLICKGDFQELFIEHCNELGQSFTVGLDNDIF